MVRRGVAVTEISVDILQVLALGGRGMDDEEVVIGGLLCTCLLGFILMLSE